MAKKKKRGNSWLTAVKSWAFRSSVKECHQNKAADTSSCKTPETHKPDDAHQDQKLGEEELEKREKRRWLFRKPPPPISNNINNVDSITINNKIAKGVEKETKYEAFNYHKSSAADADQRHAIAVAAAAAEAAVATAQAAVEIIRLTRSSTSTPTTTQLLDGGGGVNINMNDAAVIIQTSFRGYLAKKALVALRGIVKLQALIRGQNMRKQAEKTLKYMHALLRVQARVREQQARLSHDGGGNGRKSMSQLGDYHRNVVVGEMTHVRKSMSNSHERSYSGIILDEWSRCQCPPTLLQVDLESSLQAAAAAARKEALDHEATSASSDQQVWRNYESTNEDEEDERRSWVDKYWMSAATKQQRREGDSFSIARNSSTHNKTTSSPDTIVDTPKQHYTSNSYQYSPAATRKIQSPFQNQSPNQKQATPSSSPRQQRYLNSMLQQPLTPSSPSSRNNKPLLLHVRSSSPRRLAKEDKSFSTANSPSIRSFSNQQRLNFNTIPECRDSSNNEGDIGPRGGGGLPNYMAATESAKARLRSQSAPRQRPSTPERDRAVGLQAKKRLSYPVPLPEPYCINSLNNNGDDQYYCSYSANLRSPSFKSLQAGYVGMEQHSCHSCYTDSIAGETSPCSTTDLRRWLR